MSTGLLRMTLVFGSSFCLIIQTVPLPFHTGTTRLVLIIPSVILCRNKIKCHLETCYGEWVMRIPAWIKWATQEWDEVQYNGVYWDPPEVGAPGEVDPDKKYTFKYPRPKRPHHLRIYECHVGMSSHEPKVNSYLEFKDQMLPRIRKLGYNAIQIMAIQEHAYYGSFGYHVTNFLDRKSTRLNSSHT